MSSEASTELIKDPKEMSSLSTELSRLTVVEKVYYQVGDDEPEEQVSSYGRVGITTEGEDQLYQRKLKIKGGDQPIDLHLGWLHDEDNLSLLSIKNLEVIPKNLKMEDEKTKKNYLTYRTLTLCVRGTYFARIPPGESLRLSPVNWREYQIMIDSWDSDPPTVSFLVTAYPEVPLCL